jgi:ribosomal protein L7/L12
LLRATKLVAIKRYRELTGLGLAEAKAAIDRLRG